MPFKDFFHHMQEITILRYRGRKLIDLGGGMLPPFDINKEKLYCNIREAEDEMIGYNKWKRDLKAALNPKATNI